MIIPEDRCLPDLPSPKGLINVRIQRRHEQTLGHSHLMSFLQTTLKNIDQRSKLCGFHYPGDPRQELLLQTLTMLAPNGENKLEAATLYCMQVPT